MSCGWNWNDSNTSSFPNTSSPIVCRWGHLNKMWCTVSIHHSAHTEASQNKTMCHEYMTNTGTTEDNVVPSWPSIGGLPLSQDRLYRARLVCSCIVPFIQPVWHDVFVNVKFKVCIWDPEVSMRQVQSSLGSQFFPFNTPNSERAEHRAERKFHVLTFKQNTSVNVHKKLRHKWGKHYIKSKYL